MRHFNSRFAGALLVLDARRASGSNLPDSTLISQWNDLSGNNKHATQSVVANQPTFRTNIQKGQPVIRFDGSSDFMVAPGIGAQPFTVFLLGRHSANYDYYIDGVDGSNRAAIGDGLIGDSNRFSIYAGTNAISTSFSISESLTLWTNVFNGVSSSIYRYYDLKVSGSIGTQGLPNGITIGKRYTLSGYNLDGDIAYLAFLPTGSTSLYRRIQQSVIISYKLKV